MKKILLLILLVCITCGCGRKKSVSDTFYVDSLGFDKSNEDYIVYMHIPNPTTLITQEQGAGNVEIKYSVAQSAASSIYEAITNISKYTSFNINLGLVKSIILGKNFYTKENIIKLYNLLKQTPGIFPTFNVYYTEENIKDIYKLNNPKGTTPYYSLIGEYISDSLIPNKNYARFISEVFEENLTVSVPTLKINDSIWNDETSQLVSLTVSGVCALNKKTNDHIIADLQLYPGIIYLYNNLNQKTIEISNNKDLIHINYYNINIEYQKKLTIKVKTQISVLNSTLDKKIIINEFKYNIINQLSSIYKYYLDNDIDILNLYDYLYRYNYHSNIHDIEFDVIVY